MAHVTWLVLAVLYVDTVLGAARLSSGRSSRHHRRTNSFIIRGSRPSASDNLPIVDLIETPNKAYDPREKDLNYRILKKLMRKYFDPKFMSISRPLDNILKPNGTLVYKFRKGHPKGRMPSYVRGLGNYRLPDGPRFRLKLKRWSKKKLRRYMWSYTYCPVQYTWKDLGLRFWPRWLKEGVCYNGRSCSMPPGMKCKPSRSTRMTILRWHCSRWNPNENCKWIYVQYPVISDCACAC